MMQNQSVVTEFILVGLSQNPHVQKIEFVLFLSIYIGTLSGNLLIVVTILSTPALLGAPMYFFLVFLSILDMCMSSAIVPKMTVDCLYEKKTISFGGCLTQIFATHFFAGAEGVILSAMAFDRYVAICKPLHYSSIMNSRLCGILVGVAWSGGFLHSTVQIAFTSRLPFCGPNIIDNFGCHLLPLLKLACTDTFTYGLLVVVNSGFFCILIFIMLLVSYGVILFSLRHHSTEGRKKALSTCGSHVTVVLLFFVPCIFEFARPPTPFSSDKIVSIFYAVFPEFFNPLIYTFRNKEMKNAIGRLYNQVFIFLRLNKT